MVAILCPHCEEEIELEDDASGEFACPFCEGEFEWNMEPDTGSGKGGSTRGGASQTVGGIPPTAPMEWVGHGFSIFILIFVSEILLGIVQVYAGKGAAVSDEERLAMLAACRRRKNSMF